MLKFHHSALEVENIEEVLHFYKSFLGFNEIERLDLIGEPIVFLQLGDFRLEIIGRSVPVFENDQTHLCFETRGLEKIMERFTNGGFQIAEGPIKLRNGWRTVFYKGPVNEWIEILEK